MPVMDFDAGIATPGRTPPAAQVPSTASVDDVSKLGESNSISYTPKPPDLAERVGEDLTKPLIETQHNIGTGLYWLGSNLKDNTPWGGLGDRVARAGIVMKERAEDNLSKNYSNFTPNALDSLIGMAPSLAAFMGVTAMGAGALATGAVVGAAGLATTAEEFAKFKAQGHTTAESDALSAAIGIPTAGVMAAGFGVASKLTTPWLGKVLGDSIAKIAEGPIAGATGFAGQTATTGSLELATGAEHYEGKKSLIDLMSKTAISAVLGGVLGGATALPYVFKQHAAIIDGFTKLGLSNKAAKENADALLGQAGHVVMDQMEQHINMTDEEKSRVAVSPSIKSQSIQPNVLERHGIPKSEMFPSVASEDMSAQDVVDRFRNNKYVKLEPLDISYVQKGESIDVKDTTADIRSKYMGSLDKQIVRGSYLREDLKGMTPPEEQKAALFFRMHYTPEQLRRFIDDPIGAAKEKQKAIFEKSEIKGSFHADQDELNQTVAEYKRLAPEFEKAIVLSESGLKAAAEAKLYFDEAGQVAKAFGTIQEIRENYVSNRVYKPDQSQKGLKFLSKGGLKQFTPHSLERFYDDPLMAVAGGKRFATTDLADLVALHNQELAGVNHSRQLADVLSDTKPIPLAKWVDEGKIPKGWKQVGRVSKSIPLEDGSLYRRRMLFAAPEGIANGLKPLVDPDFFRQMIPGVAAVQDFQGAIKSGILSYSFFHDMTFATQTLASIDGARTLAEMPSVLKDKLMQQPAFRNMEIDGLEHNLTTAATHDVQDILTSLELKDSALSKVLKAPVAKQLSAVSEAHTKFLFGEYQRWIKVKTYGKNVAAWESKNPNATLDELREAKLGFAKATNAEFGGINWEALGIDKTRQSLLRTFLLAPDWVVSMGLATKYAFTEPFGSTAGQQARGTLFKAVAWGLAVSDGLNYLMTGHHLWDNKPNHKFEVELAPDVYLSLVRGAPGELLKLVSNTFETGGPQGIQRYIEGKASPFASSVATAFSGINYYGGDIWKGDSPLEKTVNGVWNIVSHDLPVPIGVTSGIGYAQREQDKTPLGWGAIATGAGRFSKTSDAKAKAQLNDNVIHAFRNGNNEYVEHLVAKGDLSKEEADRLHDRSLKSDLELQMQHMKIGKAMDLSSKIAPQDKVEYKKLLDEKYQNFQHSSAAPNEKKRIEKLYNKLEK